MAVWRTRAYETFGFAPGAYSFASGKVDLMSDLLDYARNALHNGDSTMLHRVLSYVEWAAAQNCSDDLQSAVDLAFFLPAFRDPQVCTELEARLPTRPARGGRGVRTKDLRDTRVGQPFPKGD